MTELEVRSGEELDRRMARYGRLRLDPSAAQAKRARAAVMEAAWRQRIAGPATVRATDATPPQAARVATTSARRGLFAGWGPRRLGVSVAAAVLAGLLVGSTAFAGSRAGGPLYDARLVLEELTLPTDAVARLEAELALAQGRLAEIVDAAARDDAGAVSAAVRGYLAALDTLAGATGEPADRALSAIAFHRTVLLDVLGRVPDDARAGIEAALENSGKVIERLDASDTTPIATPNGGAGAGNGGGGAAGGSMGPGAAEPPGKPSKEPQPAKTAAPKPERTAEPKPEPTKPPKATPAVPTPDSPGEQGEQSEQGAQGGDSQGGQGSQGSRP